MRAETVIVPGIRNGQPQQILMIVHCLDDRRQHQQELRVFPRGIARLEQVDARVCAQRPVIVLSGAVHACKGLFVQQARQTVPRRHHLHDLHRQLVVVRGDVPLGEDRGKLVLCGGGFVVLRFGEDPELPELLVQILHKGRNTRLNHAEVVILQLLTLGRLRAEQRPSRVFQILALIKELLVDQEIFLLRADRRIDVRDVLIAEQVQDPQCLLVDDVH